jgi:hypothetical protein
MAKRQVVPSSGSLAEEVKQSYLQAVHIVEVASRFKLTHLNLSGLKLLEEIPPQVADLKWLLNVNIDNTFIRDISCLASLTLLENVSAKSTKLQKLA